MKAYKLGQHILVHADSIKEKDKIQKLLEKENIKIDTILTDPPYGVAYVENKATFKDGTQISKNKIIANDEERTPDEYAEFTEKWLSVIKDHMNTYNTVYIFGADTMLCAMRKGFEMVGGYYSQLLIWVKQQVVVGRKDYLPQHEIILYGWIGRHKFHRSKDKSVIFHPKPAKSKLHPTMKPIGLLRRIILNSTQKGDWVYDPFGGSGSTLIASEHTRRRCFMVEIDKEYIDIIIKRWEKLTHNKAEIL